MDTDIFNADTTKDIIAYVFRFNWSSENPTIKNNNPKKKFIKGNALNLSVLELSK